MTTLSKITGGFLCAAILAACSAGQGTSVLPSASSSQTIYEATTPAGNQQNNLQKNAVAPQDQCHQPLIAGHALIQPIACETVSPPPGPNPIGPCVVTCDGPPQDPDPCLKDPKLPGCGDGNPIATGNPGQGEACDGSQAHGTPIELGTSNLPGGTSGSATTVVDIYSIQNADMYTAGWVYTTKNGAIFFEGNPNEASILNSFLALLGPIGAAIEDSVNNPRQVSASELKAIQDAQSSGGYHVHHCFTHPLPIG